MSSQKKQDKQRRERRPLSMKASKLNVVDQEAGYHYRWINDDPPGRIQDALSGGYEFVETAQTEARNDISNRNASQGNRVCRVVGRLEGGQPMHAYLMRISEEWYKEDQNAKQKEIDEVDNMIHRGEARPVENSYIGQAGINIGKTN